MKTFTTIACALLASLHLAGAAPAWQETPVSVSYDPKYDVKGTSLNTVACSNGQNGLITKGYSTFGSLPIFPNIGGAPTIPGWNSPNCGKCYMVGYHNGTVDRVIHVLAIDAAPGGFNIGLRAMNQLTDGQAVDLGRIKATYSQVPESMCGM